MVAGLRGSGLLDTVDAEAMRDRIADAGLWGPALFIGLHTAMVLAYLPGFIPVVGAVFAYGPWAGGALVLVSCAHTNIVAYLLARFAVGPGWRAYLQTRLETLGSGRLRLLSERPLIGVMLVRLVAPTAAAASFALTVAGVPFGTYLVGSVVGGLPQTLFVLLVASGLLQ